MRRLVIAVVVVVVLLLAADRLAAVVAANQVASGLQTAEKLAETPDVSIRGFPFLTQVLKGRYTGLDASVQNLAIDRGLEVDEVQVHLSGLHVPIRAVIGSALTSVPVDQAAVTGLVGYSSLDQAATYLLNGNGLEVHFAPGKTPDQIAVTGTYGAGSTAVKLSGAATVRADNGRLVVSVPANVLSGVPADVRGAIAGLLGSAAYRLPRLPLDLQVSQVSVGPSGVTVKASGSGVVLGADAFD